MHPLENLYGCDTISYSSLVAPFAQKFWSEPLTTFPFLSAAIFKSTGFKKAGKLFEIEKCSEGCGVLQVAHPSINVLQLYANSDICINRRCGLDMLYAEYFALSMNAKIRLVLIVCKKL